MYVASGIFNMEGGEITGNTASTGCVNPYSDVAATVWYYDAVGYATANGLVSGTSATTFDPDSPMSRSMVWTVIARLAGRTIGGTTWAEDARPWAAAAGVSNGSNPDGAISREKIVTMLYRYVGSSTVGTSELDLLGQYPDGANVSGWAQSAMAWAVSVGAINDRDGQLAAGELFTRAEVATILAWVHQLSK